MLSSDSAPQLQRYDQTEVHYISNTRGELLIKTNSDLTIQEAVELEEQAFCERLGISLEVGVIRLMTGTEEDSRGEDVV